MNLLRLLSFSTLLFTNTAPICSAAEDQPQDKPVYNPYARLLDEADIEPNRAGVTKYLQSLVPTPEERAQRDAQAAELIEQLGDPSFSQREKALHRLVAMPDPPLEKLRAAAESHDPEIRWRSELVLKLASRPNPLPEAVLRTIAILPIKGTAPAVLRVIPESATPHVRRAAEEALAATASTDDAALLRKAIESDDDQLRAAAITAYAAALGDESKNTLRPFMRDDKAQVQLAAATALANLGDRQTLPVLLELMKHEDVNVRAQSVAVLRALSGKQFGFLPYDDLAQRKTPLTQWENWVTDAGSSAKLHFPLNGNSRRPEIGHTLILVYQQHKAIELNSEGEVIWEKEGLDYPWAVQRLANGNTLIGSYRGKYVAEFDRTGEEVWRVDGLPGGVFGAKRLTNGNTLLGLHKAKKVIEVDRAGETVWEVTLDGQPMGVQRLANGNTVVALHSGNKVVEVDRAGKVLWEVTDVKIPRTVQRLPNGNTIVGDSSNRRVVEFDREGNVVWQHQTGDSVYDAQRLSNGNTLVSGSQGVVIVNPEGETVWEKKIQGTGRALRF